MKPHMYLGTSGWQFPALRAKLLEAKLPSSKALDFLATRCSSVENNSAFYSFPRSTTLEKWHATTPDDFVFSLKLNKYFTHEKKLVLDVVAEKRLMEFCSVLPALQKKLGCLLIQTSPSLPYDRERLKVFLTGLSATLKKIKIKPDLAIEFRNEQWFTQETYALLQQFNVALVASHAERLPWQFQQTANCIYVRFHGPEKLFYSTYSKAELKQYADIIRKAKHIKRVYVYFNNTMNPRVLQNLETFKQLLG